MVKIEVLECNPHEVVVHGVDPLKGFFDFGMLADPRMHRITVNMVGLNEELVEKKKCEGFITADNHERGDPELEKLPEHCMNGSAEAQIIDALEKFGLYAMKKRTTNSFIGTKLLSYLAQQQPRAVVVYGVCSNICVLQAVVTYSFIAREYDLEKIVVPLDCTTTFGDDFKIQDQIVAGILRNVPRVEVIPSYRNLGDVLEIN